MTSGPHSDVKHQPDSDDDRGNRAPYVRVIAIEVLVLLSLYFFSRYFG